MFVQPIGRSAQPPRYFKIVPLLACQRPRLRVGLPASGTSIHRANQTNLHPETDLTCLVHRAYPVIPRLQAAYRASRLRSRQESSRHG